MRGVGRVNCKASKEKKMFEAGRATWFV